MLLADLAWPDVGQRTASILAIPFGSTEQHGPHLPLSTDTDIAVATTAAGSALLDELGNALVRQVEAWHPAVPAGYARGLA